MRYDFLAVAFLIFTALAWSEDQSKIRITKGCETVARVTGGTTGVIDLDAYSSRCDTLHWAIAAVTPQPQGVITINDHGKVRFTSAAADSGKQFAVSVIASDPVSADTCMVYFNVFTPEAYRVRIQKTHNTIMGSQERINVTLEAGDQPFTGFVFTIAYSDSLLHFLEAVPGGAFFDSSGCGWEYFNYRHIASGSGCNGGVCNFARIEVAGLAAANPVCGHLPCSLPGLPAVLFSLNFQVGENRCQGQCEFLPIRFVWLDCGNNWLGLSGNDPTVDTFCISRKVINSWSGENIADSTGTYPSFLGAQICHNPDLNKPSPQRLIDFYNGGIDIICDEEVYSQGDVNLDAIQFQPADFDLFVEYFLHGLDVFRVNQAGQIAVTDVNNDSTTLSVADLAFMSTIINKHLPIPAYPCEPATPPVLETNYSICDGIVSIDKPVGAAYLVAEGNIEPKLLTPHVLMKYAFDGENTRILIYSDPNGTTVYPFSEQIVSGVTNLISAEFGSPEGGMVNAELAPPCDSTPFRVHIETVHDAVLGQHALVNVVLDSGTTQLGSFDFLISYDTIALQFSNVIWGTDWVDQMVDSIGCEWEYFTYRLHPSGCSNACPAGTIRVLAIAETNVCCHHPNCFIAPSLPSVLFTLDFIALGSGEPEQPFLPLRFTWSDCGDNMLTNERGDVAYISRNVYDLGSGNIADSTRAYPTIQGAQRCEHSESTIPLVRRIDFVNGGIQVVDPPGDTTPFRIRIETTQHTMQGIHEYIDVVLEQGTASMSGFDLLMAYEGSALNFVGATPGPDWYSDSSGCGWEYFTYRTSTFDTCGSACATRKVRVVGIAETNNGMHHPSCFIPSALPSVLFTMDFMVSDNRTYECTFLPIQFVWFDCGDNTVVTEPLDSLFLSRHVISPKDSINIADSLDSYPTFKGAQRCGTTSRYDIRRAVDFYDGGVQIDCQWFVDIHGDLNLNGLSNEVADAVLFSNYFVHGIGVFTVNVQGQTATSDVNFDGIPLTLADLVYLDRVVVGEANPMPKTPPESIEAHYTIANGNISVDSAVAAAAIVVAGNVTPTLVASYMDMHYAFDGTNTHILIYTNVENNTVIKTFNGSFLSASGDILSVEFATPEGGMVTASRTEGGLQEFILGQNYPNPFNLKTKISFSLPTASAYTLTIYNIAGQQVFETSGRGAAGINAVDWIADHEASGLYFYRLTSGNTSETKKMIFLK